VIISRPVLLRMRNVSEKFVEEIKTHFMFNNFIFDNYSIYEVKWKIIVEPDRSQIKMWPMRIEYWIPKAINTTSEYVLRIAFQCNSGYTNAPEC
jgi:hypothetical protein